MLELPSDGPPGVLHVALTTLKTGKNKDTSRGCVVCCAGCYDCMEGPSCLYNKLASFLPPTGISVLQLRYRPPGDDEEEAAEDVMTCIDWVLERKLGPILLVGWSMGAAAVVEAAYLRRTCGIVVAICTLAGQTVGTRNAKHLQVPLLALHGEEDRVLPAECSKTLVQRAQQAQTTLRLLPNTTHRMEEALPHVLEFVNAQLPVAGRC
eukprot:gnl/TRDRNA2_/TRDRNA2_161934_c0_seq1.p1 gnl/TRDRNA2_/TRDRNA2_161934_c0~~gnl/TRDRNA2_/TRDRNA2_161934_c0_seq1.p1  ORF type:complete len:208 (+),score=30.74 gnl/TRDRNA2_/TRDRNA2_161934_c0_seq1:96-719(+)